MTDDGCAAGGHGMATGARPPLSDVMDTRICADCGQPFAVTEDDVARLEQLTVEGAPFRLPKRCPECREARRQARYDVVKDDGTHEHLECATCGRTWFFGDRDRAYYASRGWTRPRRCKACRDARRQSHVRSRDLTMADTCSS